MKQNYMTTLRALRLKRGKTQTDVAEAADVDASEICRLETRTDARVSTLRRYLQGLGAELELVAVFSDGSLRTLIDLDGHRELVADVRRKASDLGFVLQPASDSRWSKGGLARAKKLSKKRRSEIATKAAKKRWSKR